MKKKEREKSPPKKFKILNKKKVARNVRESSQMSITK